MAGPLALKTRVLPGRRIEVETPELTEGEMVDVLVWSTLPGPLEGESPRDRARRFREWADSHQGVPELAPYAFEREHFYGDGR